MNSLFITRGLGVLAAITIIAGHFFAKPGDGEVYLFCVVSYWIRIVALISDVTDGNPSILILLGYAGFGLPLTIICISLLSFGLLFGIFLGLRIAFTSRPKRTLFRTTFITFYILSLVVGIGLFLAMANRSISNFKGVDQIYILPHYFILPVIFAFLGFYFQMIFRHWNTAEQDAAANP